MKYWGCPDFLFLLQICYQPFEILISVPKQQARKSFTNSSKLPQKWEKHSHLTIWTTTVSAPAHDYWGSDPSLLISEGRSQLHPTGDGTPLTPPAGGPVPTGLVAAVPRDLACTIPCQHRTQRHWKLTQRHQEKLLQGGPGRIWGWVSV